MSNGRTPEEAIDQAIEPYNKKHGVTPSAISEFSRCDASGSRVGVVIPKKSDEIGLAVYALFSIAVMLVLAFFLVIGVLHFVAGGWRNAPVSDWVLIFPIVLYLAWKLLSPVTKYAQRHGWIPQTLTRRTNAALNSGRQSPLGKVVLNAALVFLVAAGLFQSFDLAIVFFSLMWAGLLIDLVWAFVTARKPH